MWECVCLMNAFLLIQEEKEVHIYFNMALGYVKVSFLDFCCCYCSSVIPQRVPSSIHPSQTLGNNPRILIIGPLPSKPQIPGSPIADSSHQHTLLCHSPGHSLPLTHFYSCEQDTFQCPSL